MEPSGSAMLRCVLVADDGSETVLVVPDIADVPPARVRVPGSIGGAAVLDVYALSHARNDPPEAVYVYVETVPRTIDEPADADPREQGPQPQD